MVSQLPYINNENIIPHIFYVKRVQLDIKPVIYTCILYPYEYTVVKYL
jgi:hypothetical protein